MSAAIAASPAAQRLPVWRDPAEWAKTTNVVAILIALSLPWSTSLVGIFSFIWLAAVAPTLDFRLFLQSLKRPISALPIALFVLALIGTLWSDASWGARLYAMGPVAKLLVLPFLCPVLRTHPPLLQQLAPRRSSLHCRTINSRSHRSQHLLSRARRQECHTMTVRYCWTILAKVDL